VCKIVPQAFKVNDPVISSLHAFHDAQRRVVSVPADIHPDSVAEAWIEQLSFVSTLTMSKVPSGVGRHTLTQNRSGLDTVVHFPGIQKHLGSGLIKGDDRWNVTYKNYKKWQSTGCPYFTRFALCRHPTQAR